VKPSNIMLTAAGLKVVDFAMTALSAPESAAAIPADDVSALGLLSYWVLALELAWPPELSAQALLAHLGSEPAGLPALPQLPDEVYDICLRCLERDPARRPPAGEVPGGARAVRGSVV